MMMSSEFSLRAKAEKVADFRAKIKALQCSEFPVWEMEKLAEFVSFAIGKLSPLQIGDAAVLLETPEITEKKSWGWLGWKHMLVAGKRGVIRSVDWSDGTFVYSWEPEDQTWISSTDGIERPVGSPALFTFGERWLGRCEKEGA
ncbi:hypothetical protein [Caudoviricetes sp.]|nr:hypothetical protein [Caudoviricetes sp.]